MKPKHPRTPHRDLNGWSSLIIMGGLLLSACSGSEEPNSPIPTSSPTAESPTPLPVTPTSIPITPTALPGTPTPTPYVPPTISSDYSFWIGELGPVGPLWTGPHQYPFICTTVESNLGQPLIDNLDGMGNAVFPEVDGVPNTKAQPLGYSANCSLATRVDYFYFSSTEQKFKRLESRESLPSDLDSITVKGQTEPFIVRVETGTLNRFIYTIAMLAPFEETLDTPKTLNNDAWNQKLVYYLRGGVGIGHYQGFAAWIGGVWGLENRAFKRVFEEGYAIATSTGNETGVHYNMNLAEETAFMVKEHFKATYGDPRYTVGIGGSGGGVQQYMFGQNQQRRDDDPVLDAGIPLYSYPDMVTQTTPVGDCNILEQYFMEEVTADPSSRWATWSQRPLIEGMNASDTVENSVFGTMGSSECIEGWFFGEPLVLNPQFTIPDYLEALATYRYPSPVVAGIKWTHFNDLENVYGTDARGFAPNPWDNVGVQYGLAALVNGDISTSEFLEINSCAGSWTEQENYVMWDPVNDPFDANNMVRDAIACRAGEPAPRREGDPDAIKAAFESGHVFVGDINIPLIDLRPYLEDRLDMHNTRQSFASRQRMLNFDGDASNQVIWFYSPNDPDEVSRIMEALKLLDEKLTGSGPATDFQDRCYNDDGTVLAQGEGVWGGILDTQARGVCTEKYQIKSSSRMVAGENIAGDVFKCQVKPLDTALTDGTYGAVSFTQEELILLSKIFPEGVCDYSLPGIKGPPR